MTQPHFCFEKGFARKRAAISAMTLLCGVAKADITGSQAQAMAENSNGQMAKFLLGVLGACANCCPDKCTDVVHATRSMATIELADMRSNSDLRITGRAYS